MEEYKEEPPQGWRRHRSLQSSRLPRTEPSAAIGPHQSAAVAVAGQGKGDPGAEVQRDMLLVRIEPMERQMQLVRRDNEKERHKLFRGYETEEGEETELSEKIKLEHQPEPCETSQALQSKPFSCGRSGKGHKRKIPFGKTLKPSERRVFCAVKRIELTLCRVRLFRQLILCELWEGGHWVFSGSSDYFLLGSQLEVENFTWASALQLHKHLYLSLSLSGGRRNLPKTKSSFTAHFTVF